MKFDLIKTIFTAGILCFAISTTSASANEDASTPEEAIDQFMQFYQDEDVDGMITYMLSCFPDMPTTSMYQVKLMLGQALELYGKPSDYEIYNVEVISKRVQRIEAVLHHEDLPTFWTYTLYSREGSWLVANFNFQDLLLWSNQRSAAPRAN